MAKQEKCPYFKPAKDKYQFPPAVCRRYGFSIDLTARNEPVTPEQCPLFQEGLRGINCNVIKPQKPKLLDPKDIESSTV